MPTIKHVKVFGSRGFAQFPEDVKRVHKFSGKAIPAIFLGLSKQHRAYVVYIPAWRCVKDCATLKLDEERLLKESKKKLGKQKLNSYEDLFISSEETEHLLTAREIERTLAVSEIQSSWKAPRSYKQIQLLPQPQRDQWNKSYELEYVQ